jgi:alkylhydroperoxidase family enzyme
VRAVLEDYRSAPIGAAERELFAFLERVNGEASAIRREDVDRLRALDWSDSAIYDAITVCALFNFYNRWTDATGVQDMSPAAYEAAGQRMAEHGYMG